MPIAKISSILVDPLCAVSNDDRNLMDIRFSPVQRRELQTQIKCGIAERRPLSLLRLGWRGSSYPPRPAKEVDPDLFKEDDRGSEHHRWGWGGANEDRG